MFQNEQFPYSQLDFFSNNFEDFSDERGKVFRLESIMIENRYQN